MSSSQELFLQQTRWLRPFTRVAASFAFRTAGWLPEVIRNAPLKLIKRILRGHQERMHSGCKTS
jgi:hypothetical protein